MLNKHHLYIESIPHLKFKRGESLFGAEGGSNSMLFKRRTFITNAARKISAVEGSLRDVQTLAGHLSLSTTQRYIEVNIDAKRLVVELI